MRSFIHHRRELSRIVSSGATYNDGFPILRAAPTTVTSHKSAAMVGGDDDAETTSSGIAAHAFIWKYCCLTYAYYSAYVSYV